MTEDWLAGLGREFAAFAARVDGGPTGADRQAVKRDITLYF